MRALGLVVIAVLLTGCAGGAGGDEPSTTPSPSASETATPTPTPTPTPTETAPPAPIETPVPSAAPAPPPPPTPPPAPASGDIDSAASLQVVVNKLRPLQPANYVPNLVSVSVSNDGNNLVRPELNAALVELDAAMRGAIGEGVYVFSAYRSYDRQVQVYGGYVQQYGQAEADTTSARPGHSEHQTGLAVDVVGTSGNCQLNTCFGETQAGIWLAENAWQYGFVVRYPNGLESITGYEYEPWHLRFVGVETATAMHSSGAATLEEYFGLPAAPGYA